MIESIDFRNYKAMRKATLQLAPFTLLLGPNGSGKTTVLQALARLAAVATNNADSRGTIASEDKKSGSLLCITAIENEPIIRVRVHVRLRELITVVFEWHPDGRITRAVTKDRRTVSPEEGKLVLKWLSRTQVFSFDSHAIEQPATVSTANLKGNGFGLAAVLDDLKDNHDERWNALLAEMREWLPEYDQILFDKPQPGNKSIALRTKKGGHRIPATDLSQGTLVALALLSLAHLPDPPSIVGIEEIDRGLHPRLLRHLQDALYRLSYPETCGETRPPIQVIATTHSPYLLDLYRDHPEEVVLAQKEGLEVQFKQLSRIEHFQDILGSAPLSEVWYSGVFGGVSVKP